MYVAARAARGGCLLVNAALQEEWQAQPGQCSIFNARTRSSELFTCVTFEMTTPTRRVVPVLHDHNREIEYHLLGVYES